MRQGNRLANRVPSEAWLGLGGGIQGVEGRKAIFSASFGKEERYHVLM